MRAEQYNLKKTAIFIKFILKFVFFFSLAITFSYVVVIAVNRLKLQNELQEFLLAIKNKKKRTNIARE